MPELTSHGGSVWMHPRYRYIKNHKKPVKKTGKHGLEEWKSTKEAKDSKPKPRKVNYGQASVKNSVNYGSIRTIQGVKYTLAGFKRHSSLSLVETQEGMPYGFMKETHHKVGICTKLSAKEAQGVTITDCQAGNPCELRYDPTDHRWHPMIEE
ncbi:hypothetical protein Tco_1268184 [Tanacetum coccineum]